jgi:Mce-associated membrane protein
MSTATEEATTTEAAAQPPRTVSLRLSTVLTTVTIAALVAAVVTFASLYFSAEATIADREARDADAAHVEQIASDYGVGASTIDYRDVRAWFTRLKTGTTPQLAAKFDATAPQLEQILLPLQWTSKATPLSATVTSESGGIYKVNAYLDVVSTSAQTPDGTRTTVTYSLTVDRNADWQITEVGGLQNALPTK